MKFVLNLKFPFNSIFRIKCGKACFNARASHDKDRGDKKEPRLAELNTFHT